MAVDRADGAVTRRISAGREIAAPCPEPMVAEAGRTPEGLNLDVRVDRVAVTPGSAPNAEPSEPAANVTVSLENPTGDDVWMSFGDPCFLQFRVERPDGAPVSFAEAGDGCIQVTAASRLRPGERI